MTSDIAETPAAAASDAQGPASARAERMEARAAALAKAASLVNVVVGVAAVRTGFSHYAVGVTLAVLTVCLCTAFCLLLWRTLRIPRWAATGDLLWTCTLLIANPQAVRAGQLHSWAYFAYPYSLVALVVYAVAYSRLSTVCATTALVAGCYLAGSAWHGDHGWDTVPNALSGLAISPVVWAIAGELRRSARHLDQARAAAERSAARLAQEEERNNNHRILHDRVLQTLELITAQRVPLDADLREQIAADAAWLRQLVETGREPVPHDLIGAFTHLAAQSRRRGQHVELNMAALTTAGPSLEGRQIAALRDAAAEALTNAHKHSGVNRATIRITTPPGRVRVTIADTGRGFDATETRPHGTGLHRSINGRMQTIGGQAHIDSTPGEGTIVTLEAPCEAPHARAEAPWSGASGARSGG